MMEATKRSCECLRWQVYSDLFHLMSSDASRNYLFKDCVFPSVLNLGIVQITDADKLPATDSLISIESDEVFIRLDAPGALFALYVFRFPGGEKEFQRVSEFFDERKQRVTFPEGIKFVPEHLAVADAPASWSHDAWANSKSEVFHTYRSSEYAFLARWMGTKTVMISHPLFTMVRDNLRIHENRWFAEFPESTLKPDVVYPYSAIPISESLQLEIRDACARARSRLSILPNANPVDIHRALHDYLDVVRMQDGRSTEETRELAIELGALWGDALCTAARWEWRSLIEKEKSIGVVICNPEQSHMTNSLSNLNRLLKTKPRDKANNSYLLFDMILVGSLPPASPGALMNLS